MRTIRFKAETPAMTAQVIRELRALSSLSIAELRQRASNGMPLLEFQVFTNAWEETKRSMRRVLELVEAGRLPLIIHVFSENEGFPTTERAISTSQLRRLFVLWAQIEHQVAVDVELEEGYIQSPDEYVQEPDDNGA